MERVVPLNRPETKICFWHIPYSTCIMLSLSLPVFQVKLDWLPLLCNALVRPSQLSYLGSSVGRASAS